MKKITQCPACAAAQNISAFLEADAQAHERFIAFSRRNYDGVMDSWLEVLQLVVMHCEVCGHYWYRDQPDWQQLSRMYDATAKRHAAKGVPSQPTSQMHRQMRRLRRLVAIAGAPTSKPTLLDYGSGLGRWARAAQEADFVVTAFEPSASRGNISSVRIATDLAQLRGQRFDAINIEQVLEHIGDPYPALVALHGLCHERTILRITVPNLKRTYEGESLWAEWPFDGTRPHTLAPFEHLQGFVPHSLRVLVERAAFGEVGLFSVAIVDPILALRRAIGRLYPKLDSTHLFLRPQPRG